MDSQNFPIVETEYGPVKGFKTKSVLGTDFCSFRGIPYMKAPLGKLRFREAQSPKNWSDPIDATQECPSYCMTDFMTGRQDGQENAGVINVFSKDLKPRKLLPVMIWIHGGGFCRGSSRTDLYGPDYLLEKDVVVVSFNYRLGLIGFLSLDDPSLEIPGNVGIKDQVFALKWVQKNIKNFGGDPKQCTVFGESAGGASIHFLCLTQHTKNLFQRAIIMSGTAFNKSWSLVTRNNQAERIAKQLGWNGKSGNEREILNFLENVPAFELDDALQTFLNDEQQFGYGQMIPFGPVIEPYDSDNCIVFKDPIEMAREAWSNDIDVIVTGTSFEGILRAFVSEEKTVKYLKNPSYFVPSELGMSLSDEKAFNYGTRIKKLFYEDGQEPSLENQEPYLHYSSCLHFWHGIHRMVQSRNINAKGKTFLMRFDVDGELNVFKKLVKKCEKYKGACHADDVFYLFTTFYHTPPPANSPEFLIIQKFVAIFTSFAISGDPNCDEVKDITIKPNDGLEPLKCINITLNDFAEIELPEANKLKVWNSIYKEQNVPLI